MSKLPPFLEDGSLVGYTHLKVTLPRRRRRIGICMEAVQNPFPPPWAFPEAVRLPRLEAPQQHATDSCIHSLRALLRSPRSFAHRRATPRRVRSGAPPAREAFGASPLELLA